MEMALSDQAIGALQGPAFVALYAVSLLIAGHSLRGIDPRRLAGGAVLLWTVGGLVFALSPSFLGLACGRALLGAGQAAFVPAALLLIGQETQDARRARGLAIFTAGSASGRSVALLMGGWLMSFLGPLLAAGSDSWRAMCIIMILPNLVLAVLLFRWSRGQATSRVAGLGLPHAIRAVAAAPGRLISLGLASAGTVMAAQAAGAWAPSILHRNFGLGVPESAMAFGAVVLVFAPAGHLLAGWLAGRKARPGVSPDRVMVGALLIAAICATGLAAAQAAPMALAALIAFVLSSGIATAMGMILFQGQIDAALRGSASALFLALTATLGLGIGPWLTGALSDAIGPDHGLAWALAGVTGLTAISVAGIGLAYGRRWRDFASPPKAGQGAMTAK